MPNREEKARLFRQLHEADSGFVMPNAWDAGSTILLGEAGFPALATTSAGIAFSLGKPDGDDRHPDLSVTRAEMADRMRQIVEATPLPVNGDLQAGFGDSPDEVARTIRLAIEIGLAGGNIEDKIPDGEGLYDEALAVERIRAARRAVDASGSPFVLTARTDVFLVAGADPAAAAIRRCNLFRAAGADCLYPPGVADLDTIRTLVQAIDGPLNIVTGLGRARLSTGDLLAAGVQRISLGASIARAALGFLRASAKELHDHGTIGFAAGQIAQTELNALFVQARTR
jgi:2-methylisocitrate lyase-like PEP mutase family enzyme